MAGAWCPSRNTTAPRPLRTTSMPLQKATPMRVRYRQHRYPAPPRHGKVGTRQRGRSQHADHQQIARRGHAHHHPADPFRRTPLTQQVDQKRQHGCIFGSVAVGTHRLGQRMGWIVCPCAQNPKPSAGRTDVQAAQKQKQRQRSYAKNSHSRRLHGDSPKVDKNPAHRQRMPARLQARGGVPFQCSVLYAMPERPGTSWKYRRSPGSVAAPFYHRHLWCQAASAFRGAHCPINTIGRRAPPSRRHGPTGASGTRPRSRCRQRFWSALAVRPTAR